MQFKTLAFLSILSILVLSGCDSKTENESSNKAEKKEVVVKKTNFILKTTDNLDLNVKVDGDKIIFKDYPEKLVLLNFFATWCPPCKAEIPNLIELQNKYANDFKVVSVLLEDNKSNEDIIEFINEYKINYAVTNGKQNFLLSEALGEIKSIPTMFLLDKESKIFQKYVGIVPVEMMEIDIKKLLEK
ncbi:TlpA family protein disulfide reductase [Poseidonibacter ostreae]|mgnify:FL=1|uniref:Redoxin domain-containing protein n=1 Tax=Poseidonibacter ostreae TaxID=2654171 RepID=A0ABQ6VQC6_9BACT|nr:TlpA disulfide reductase family protein [Poseidonibacter ostreae]KAB7884936.1 redoxin domain-containing protein [Poseidonibacter ostreae]KAB7892981.1 redoxin domain-containing protein [Poseidonibacter ostreae]